MLEKKDINVFKGRLKAGEVLSLDEMFELIQYIEILELLLDQTDDNDFMGFGFDGWREFYTVEYGNRFKVDGEEKYNCYE